MKKLLSVILLIALVVSASAAALAAGYSEYGLHYSVPSEWRDAIKDIYLGDDRVEACNPSPLYTPLSFVSIVRGDKGDRVRGIQEMLISRGYLDGSADGDFGPKTESALKAYQQAMGLPVTGECDYDTYRSLDDDMQSKATEPKLTPKPTSTPEPVVEEPAVYDYIYNKNTKKFHEIGCASVDQMKDKNKGYFSGDRQELINRGYKPCKNCDP